MYESIRGGLQAISIALALSALVGNARAQELPEGKGKEIVQDACSQCHGLQQIIDSKKTPEEWKDLVNQMIDNGATLTDEQIPIVIDYLAKNFPKADGGMKSNDAEKSNQSTKSVGTTKGTQARRIKAN